MDDTDKSWRRWGEKDPYFGVLTDPRFRRAVLTDSARSEFFRSGEEHIERILLRTDELFGRGRRGSALDFGCGVGRILIPMARRFDTATGVDISEGMLAEARRNAESQGGARNIELVESDDRLTRVNGSFDFVHTFIVMQHIPPSRGKAIIGRLCDLLNPGGIAVVHILLHREMSAARRLSIWLRKHFVVFQWLRNVLEGDSLNAPLMQMNYYDLNSLLFGLSRRGVRGVHVDFFQEGDNLGGFLFFQKT